MKVLVTGASGFVGRHVVTHLLERGHRVTALARDAGKAQGLVWFDRVEFLSGDVHADRLPDRLGQLDAVIHLAWPGLPNYRELFHFEQNLIGDYRFLKSLVEQGVGQLLVAGTCFEYGLRNGCLAEDLPTLPANPYALAKDSLRKFLQQLQRHHSFTLQWARLFYLYGEGQHANSLLAQLERAIADGRPTFDMSGGEQLRDYLPIEVAARRLVQLVERPDANGVYNVCSGTPISIRTLVERHIRKRGADIALNLGYHAYPDYEPMAFWGNRRKLTQLLGTLD
ncbi:NAD-dependent epimerase/dehydratase family protein [Methylomonas sp. MED-D]|uniref:NAD-dependent epimerase/dehydratase family protein n=1 Tax=unclassified Methylomonas TaxID=2608980 RepID=UPI0028A44F7D|nr:NAD(P)-dependent oxidoreductase [Methylomonas sp. MV1]MDT4329975.1 NAD(P)-dependent oxidoreductase [Methylomonas sp. MV1]